MEAIEQEIEELEDELSDIGNMEDERRIIRNSSWRLEVLFYKRLLYSVVFTYMFKIIIQNNTNI